MQYVEVAVNAKINKIDQLFTYSIPPQFLPDIKIGILLDVPFGGRKIKGVVVDIKKITDPKIKAKLKPILKIITKFPVISKTQIDLAHWLSNYYFSPIGQVIFFMIPPILKMQTSFTNLPKKINTARQHNTYTIYDNLKNRFKNYISLMKYARAKNRQVLALFADLNIATYFTKITQKYFSKESIALISSQMKNSQKISHWLKINSSNTSIVIATRSAIFSPFTDLGLIIIDQPENYGYKEEQTLRYHTLQVAKKISELSNCHLIIGSDAPSVESSYLEQKDNYKALKNNTLNKNIAITLVDSNKDKGYISWQLQEEIINNLSKKQKTLILVNKRGDGAYLSCLDCGYIFICPNCNLPLIPYSDATLKCPKCDSAKQTPEQCPKCSGAKLKNTGLGVQKIACELKKIFNSANILTIDKSNKTLDDSQIKNSEIIVGTQKIFEYPQISAYSTAIIGIDNTLNFPDYQNTENAFALISKLKNITGHKLIIQTYNFESKFMQFISAKYDQKIINEELEKRKKLFFPPFSQLAKLIYREKDEKICQTETEKIFNELVKKNVKNSLEIIGPMPCFIVKKRNNFYWQIIIKNKKHRGINDFKIKEILADLPLKKGWRVDIDPLNLL
jgi:primosomal protein N' (replication factor Y)